MHRTGAVGGFGVSYGAVQSAVQVLGCAHLFCWGGKRKGYQCSYLYVFSEVFPPSLPLGLFTGEDGRARSGVLWYTVIILSKVFSVIWIFSTTAK